MLWLTLYFCTLDKWQLRKLWLLYTLNINGNKKQASIKCSLVIWLLRELNIIGLAFHLWVAHSTKCLKWLYHEGNCNIDVAGHWVLYAYNLSDSPTITIFISRTKHDNTIIGKLHMHLWFLHERRRYWHINKQILLLFEATSL
jgi:hypothetical protein